MSASTPSHEPLPPQLMRGQDCSPPLLTRPLALPLPLSSSLCRLFAVVLWRLRHFCSCRPPRRGLRESGVEGSDWMAGGGDGGRADGSLAPQPPPNPLRCCWDPSICPCAREGVECHVEGANYCQCSATTTTTTSSSSSSLLSCANPHGLYQFDEHAVRQHAVDVLYPRHWSAGEEGEAGWAEGTGKGPLLPCPLPCRPRLPSTRPPPPLPPCPPPPPSQG